MAEKPGFKNHLEPKEYFDYFEAMKPSINDCAEFPDYNHLSLGNQSLQLFINPHSPNAYHGPALGFYY
jgi:hypothetical protein